MILSHLRRLVITSVKYSVGRSKAELVAENAFLRVPLMILKRQVKRPACTKTNRLLVLFARAVRAWKQALVLVQPETYCNTACKK